MNPPPLPVIGVVRTRYGSLEDTPIQAGLNRAEHATVDVDPAYQDGLDGLAGFDYMWLLTWLHHRDDPIDRPLQLRQTPFLLRGTGRQLGVFATRGPRRVNPIGLSLVRILGVAEHRVAFAGVDLLDGTPVLDLKPYVAAFDRPPGDPACGWFDEVTMVEGITPAALAALDPAAGENPSGSRPD